MMQHVADHHLLHGSVWESGISGVDIMRLLSVYVLNLNCPRHVNVFLLCNIQVIVDKKGSKGDLSCF